MQYIAKVDRSLRFHQQQNDWDRNAVSDLSFQHRSFTNKFLKCGYIYQEEKPELPAYLQVSEGKVAPLLILTSRVIYQAARRRFGKQKVHVPLLDKTQWTTHNSEEAGVVYQWDLFRHVITQKPLVFPLQEWQLRRARELWNTANTSLCRRANFPCIHGPHHAVTHSLHLTEDHFRVLLFNYLVNHNSARGPKLNLYQGQGDHIDRPHSVNLGDWYKPFCRKPWLPYKLPALTKLCNIKGRDLLWYPFQVARTSPSLKAQCFGAITEVLYDLWLSQRKRHHIRWNFLVFKDYVRAHFQDKILPEIIVDEWLTIPNQVATIVAEDYREKSKERRKSESVAEVFLHHPWEGELNHHWWPKLTAWQTFIEHSHSLHYLKLKRSSEWFVA